MSARSYLTMNRVILGASHETAAHAWQALIVSRVRRGSGRDEIVRTMEQFRAGNIPGKIAGPDPRNREKVIKYTVSVQKTEAKNEEVVDVETRVDAGADRAPA